MQHSGAGIERGLDELETLHGDEIEVAQLALHGENAIERPRYTTRGAKDIRVYGGIQPDTGRIRIDFLEFAAQVRKSQPVTANVGISTGRL